MIEQSMTGPKLSDHDFFSTTLDTSQPALSTLRDAAADKDYATARRLFASHVRETLQPDRFFAIRRQFRGTTFMYPDESPAAAAERILRLELISCGTPHQFESDVDWFANPTVNQYKEWTWQLSRHPEWGILAERYRETGDERYAQGLARLFSSWVRQAVVPEPVPGNHTLCWRTIETGIRMGGVWQWALHSFYRSPYFDDDLLVDWYKSVWEHGWRLRNFHWTHNWLIMEMNGLAQIAILYPLFKDAPEWKAYAMKRMVEELDKQVYPDGFQYELTTNYHQVNIRNYQWLWDVCEAYEEPMPPEFRTVLERMHTANIYMMMPDGRLPDVNDGGWLEVAPLMERAVEIYPDRRDFLWAASRGEKGEPPAERSFAFDYAGYYIMRSGWRDRALWALFDGGPFGYAHQHEDKLNLLVHAYGKLLLTEAGDYAYDTSEMRRYVLSTRGHNTIRVDGMDQNRRLAFDRHDLSNLRVRAGATWASDSEHDQVSAIYDEGYGPQADRSVIHRRRVVFNKQPPAPLSPFFLVEDLLSADDDGPHEFQLLWHFNGDKAVVDLTRSGGLLARSIDAGEPNLTVLSTPLPGLKATLVEGQEEPEWQGWRSIVHNHQGQYRSTPTVDCRWRAIGGSRVLTLLYPTAIGEICPVVSIEKVAGPDPTLRLSLANGTHLEERVTPNRASSD